MPCAFHAERPYLLGEPDAGCQFDAPEGELIEVDGERWCLFHAPMKDKAGNATEKGGWDEARIGAFNDRIFKIIETAVEEKKAADLTGVVFPGGVNFSLSVETFPSVFFHKAH
ncbi:MAG: hypothetical protein HYY66_06575, partial [Candidatus Tectomicrobia bacterium]|nr:hypothetical protein [Candidatus Tectomicrobia bacterium]